MEPMADTARAQFGGHDVGCGTRVEVRNHFVSSWSDGFEVTRVDGNGYRVRRVSDHVELPAVFAPDEVRPRAVTYR